MAGLSHRLSLTLSLHRQIMLSSISRLQQFVGTQAFHVTAGSARGDSHSAAEELLNKIHDKDLVKTLGFINGEWVSASDGSTIPVSIKTAVDAC
jgi:hypothetical protein